jgi:hypothetical protein
LSISTDTELTVSVDRINDESLIVLHNSNCDEKFFNAVCEYLKLTDLIFITGNDTKAMKAKRGIVICLDQKYNVGKHTMIFAPFDNDRNGDSDLLTLSMKAAFDRNDFEVNDIRSGKVNINDEKDKLAVTYEPFQSEIDIEPERNVSLTTIAFSFYDLVSPKDIAISIYYGILRYYYYLDNVLDTYDLIYRARTNENISDISEVFACNKDEILRYNKLTSDVIDSPQVLINPIVEKQKVLSKTTHMNGTLEKPFYSKIENILQ